MALFDDEDGVYDTIPRDRPVPLPAPTPPPTGGGGDTTVPPVSTVEEEVTASRRRGGGQDQGYPGMGGPVIRIPGAPGFTPPQFNRPTLTDAYNEPGYQFRVQAGNEALERSAAARGTLRTGGTLKDLVEYGQNFAAQEHGQVFNRALSAYDRQYQGARDAHAPRLAEWQARTNAEMARAMAAYGREWDAYTFARRGGGGGGRPDPIEAPPDPNTYIPSVPAVPSSPTGLPGRDLPEQTPQSMMAGGGMGGYGGDDWYERYYA